MKGLELGLEGDLAVGVEQMSQGMSSEIGLGECAHVDHGPLHIRGSGRAEAKTLRTEASGA